ncbi:MAG: DUF4446 family protein [Candidatus Moraniibacteriota bacterium]
METINQLIERNLFILSIIISILILTIFFWNIFLQLKIKKIQTFSKEFFKGKKVDDLEEILLSQAKNLKLLDKDIQELYNISNTIHTLALKSLHKSAVIRFNPFKDVGGNQSFSIALLDGKNNGLTITALYTKEGTRVYSKSILDGDSKEFPLSEEEKQVVKIAMTEEKK